MRAKYLLLALLLMVITQQSLNAQFGFSHELGVIAGPVAFQSDYGERSNVYNKLRQLWPRGE